MRFNGYSARNEDNVRDLCDLVPEIVQHLTELAESENGVSVIPLRVVHDSAQRYQLSLREIELIAVESRLLPWRHSRSLGTVGWDGLVRLLRSTVAVIGLGGLGGYVVEGLARMAVGHLILIDGDVFAEHNLNRQLLSTEDALGRSKAEVARERVLSVNSTVSVTTYAEFVTSETLPVCLEHADVLVDCTDRLPIRLVMQDAAWAVNLPMVHGAIAGYIGQVMTILPGDVGLRALYGDRDIPDRGIEVELGNPAATPMMVAAWQVQETIKLLLGQGTLLRNRMLFMDAESGTVEILKLG